MLTLDNVLSKVVDAASHFLTKDSREFKMFRQEIRANIQSLKAEITESSDKALTISQETEEKLTHFMDRLGMATAPVGIPVDDLANEDDKDEEGVDTEGLL